MTSVVDEREMQARIMQSAGPKTVSTKTSFFDADAMEWMPVSPDPDNFIWLKALVNNTDPGGSSLQAVRYSPNAVIPRHRHDIEQVVYVVEGEVRQGRRVFRPGSGYFTPRDGGYALQVGPEGVVLLEFRPGPLNFSTEWMDDPTR